TYAAAKAALPAFVGWCEWQGPGKLAMTQAEVLAVGEFEAWYNELIWKTDAVLGDTYINYGDGCGSRATIILPHGAWDTKIPCLVAYNTVIGQGSGNWSNGSVSTGGTRITIDHGKWISRVFPERNCMQTENYLRKEGYQESYNVSGIRLEGGYGSKVYDPSFVSYGFASHDAGETSVVENVYSIGFNTSGFHFRKGTPGSGHQLSAFSNGVAGFLFTEGSVNTGYFNTLSGDDNPTLILVDAGAYPGGGTLVFDLCKNETGTRQPNRFQIALTARGAFNILMTGVSMQALEGSRMDAAFVVNAQGYPAQLDVRGYRECGNSTGVGSYATLLQDGTSRWSHPPYCVPINFTWTHEGNMTSNRALTKTACACKDRLGGYVGAGTWNYQNCTPAYGSTAPPPPPPTSCSWVLGTPGTWSACSNGMRSRITDYVTSPLGCTPTTNQPASIEETEACTVTPPPSSGFTTTFSGSGPNLVATTGTDIAPKYSWSRGTISGGKITVLSSTSYPWTGSASKVVYQGLTIASIGNWTRINDITKLAPDGKVYVNGTVVATIKAGVKTNLTIDVPSGVILSTVIGSSFEGSDPGGTQPMTIEGMEVYR
ncbi:MAG: hypothetical protein KDC00_11270, partial [Flavobacteriales bacterium]|nr:hypothetical protein [Flavobacteriales bacterium]